MRVSSSSSVSTCKSHVDSVTEEFKRFVSSSSSSSWTRASLQCRDTVKSRNDEADDSLAQLLIAAFVSKAFNQIDLMQAKQAKMEARIADLESQVAQLIEQQLRMELGTDGAQIIHNEAYWYNKRQC